MKTLQTVVPAMAALLVATVTTAFTLPDHPFTGIETHSDGPVEFLSGGREEQQRAQIRSLGSSYNLKLVIVDATGAFVSDARVTDHQGRRRRRRQFGA